jgi:hypothetical protein
MVVGSLKMSGARGCETSSRLRGRRNGPGRFSDVGALRCRDPVAQASLRLVCMLRFTLFPSSLVASSA